MAYLYVGGSVVLRCYVGAYGAMEMAGIGVVAEKNVLLEVYSRGWVGDLLEFSVRGVSRPQLSFSLEERGARPSYVV